MKTFDLIMPCYNEQNSLERLVINRIIPLREACKKELKIDLNLIIVDDASKDNSLKIAKKLAKEYDWIKLYKHEKNQGKGAALKTGLAKADGDFIGIQDADEEYNPMNYLTLLKPILDGKADVVYGSRYLRPDTRRVLSFWHTLMNKFLTLCSNMFTGLDVSDMETCYKLFTKKAAHELAPQLKESRFGFEPEITSYVAQGHYRVYECAIEYTPRTYEEGKKITYKDGFHALYCILHYGAPYAPLPMQFLLYTFIGGVCAIANLLLFIVTITGGASLFWSVWISFLLAAALNYWLCAVLLFKHKAFWSGTMEALMYVVTLVVMGISDYLITAGLIVVGCGSVWAKLVSTIICFIGNFVFRKYLVFPMPKKNNLKGK